MTIGDHGAFFWHPDRQFAFRIQHNEKDLFDKYNK